jgi:membrane protein required for colicin V production
MNLPLTALDLLVILVVLLSAGYAAWKGFLWETLTIFDWLAAAFGCLYFGPYLVPMMRGVIAAPWVAGLVAYAVTFLIVFIPLSFISHRFSESVKNSPIGPLDRALGIVFGVVRGLVAVALVYLAYTYFVPISEQGRFVRQARSLPMIQSTSQVILSLVPTRTKSDFTLERPESPPPHDAIGDLIRENGASGQATGAAREPARESPHRTPAKKAAKGYGAQDRRALDTLLKDGGGSSR